MTDREGRRRAGSYYKGIKVTVTMSSDDGPCLVSLRTKQEWQAWDEWDLLFPAIRVPIPPAGIGSYEDILRVIASSIGALLEADERYR